MASSMLPPNPSLVAIILIIKTGSGGPRRVFHYPPKPGHDKPHVKLDYENSSSDSSSSSGNEAYSGYSSLEDDSFLNKSGSASPEKRDSISLEESRNRDEGFLGLPNDLPHLLCPPPTLHQKKFEISIGGWVFLGRPVFARDNGEWKRRKPKKAKAGKETENTRLKPTESSRKTSAQHDDNLAESSGYDSVVDEEEATTCDEAAEGFKALRIQEISEKQEREKTEQSWKEVLNMFHVVFVLDPPPHEHQVRVNDMYKHVVKKFSRALKWEQARSEYVLEESLRMREVETRGGVLRNDFHFLFATS